jgi:beta-lactamase regulating signal transducer with metallopeptidase domain
MTAYDVPFLWCVLQAALLSTLGVVAAWLFARRAPAAGATAAAAAAVMIAVVTMLIPVRVPRVELWTPSQSGNLVDAMAPAALNEKVTVDESLSSGGVSFDVEDLAARLLTSMGVDGVAEQEFGPLIESCVVGLFAIGAVVGTLRFLWALSFVARLRRDRAPIVDDGASRLFAELKGRLGVVRSVELCESPRIASPAVIGWRRPIVLLPTERGDWTEEQLRATLAHELAHVVRGDFFWRFVAGAMQAIHFFHPLVHLLTRRLTLMQELATDRLAATVAGGSTTYLRALSELAIRLDDKTRLRAEPIVLPALSSNLMRRIVMLRSKEGSEGARNHPLASAFAVGLIAVAGLGTMALRGKADGIEPTPTGGAEVARLFSRSPLSTGVLGSHDDGLFVIRPSEMAKLPQFRPVLRLLDSMLLEELYQVEGADVGANPGIRLESIEYIAGIPELQLKPKTGQAEGQEGVFKVGMKEFVVRFQEDVPWEERLNTLFPGAKLVSEDGLTYFTLPPDGLELSIAVRDDRTLVFASDMQRLRELATVDERTAANGLDAWSSLEGGLATLIARGSMAESELPRDPGAKMAVTIMMKVDEYGAAFDVDPETNESKVRLLLTAKDRAAADMVKSAVDGLLPLLIATMREQIDVPATPETPGHNVVQVQGDADTERNVRNYWIALLESVNTRLEPQTDGAVQVRIEGGAVLPPTIMTGYSYVATGETEGAPAWKNGREVR